ncbi:MAG: hypothetical protein IIA85_02630 [Nanoarchaeota archaeon]|nr:hypothetical protein [Nanoarchaeota archaeon]
MKIIIFDSGTLISFTMAGIVPELIELKKIFDGKFIITSEVKVELVDKPMNNKRFELEAMKIQQLLDDKVLELPESIGIKDSEIKREIDSILKIANNLFTTKRGPVKLIHFGETSCLALSKILNKKKIENVIAVDERTTRMLGEKPENLKKLMERRLHSKINAKEVNYKFFKEFKFIRSTELIYVAYKKKLVRFKKGPVLDALLYALKFKGAAISSDEISEIKRIG